MANGLNINCFTLGDFQTNCYIACVPTNECWIIDAGFGPQPMLQYIAERDLAPSRIVLTHAHVDHIAGLEAVHAAFPDVPILIHEEESGHLIEPFLNLSALMGSPIVAPQATDTLKHGEVLTLGDLPFEIRHTPGHSPGGICLYQPEHGVAIVGDTLFAGSIGRHDFPTSDQRSLMRSIREQLLTLPDDTRILPGHGEETTIGQERANNPFLK